MSANKILVYLSVKHSGEWEKIYEAIQTKQIPSIEEVNKVVNSLKTNYITLLDEEYPSELKEVFRPPFVLFYKGDVNLLKNYDRHLGVVGAREPSEYGKNACVKLVKELALDYTIISGLALGIDGIAHKTAIDNFGKTIAIIGNGLDCHYPNSNFELQEEIAKNHLLISEFPDGVTSKPSNFVFRNRIVVGLSKGVLAFDVKKMSGTLSSVNLAASLNKYLLSVPYPIGSDFENNKFIKEGANLVENAEDVKDILEHF